MYNVYLNDRLVAVTTTHKQARKQILMRASWIDSDFSYITDEQLQRQMPHLFCEEKVRFNMKWGFQIKEF